MAWGSRRFAVTLAALVTVLAGGALAPAATASVAPLESVAPTQSKPPHLIVGDCRGTDGYDSIQKAVDAVRKPNRVIEVCPGDYAENVKVVHKKKLVIVGITDSMSAARVVPVTGDAFTVKNSTGVRIELFGVLLADTAVRVDHSPTTFVHGLVVASSDAGIRVGPGSRGTWALDNEITGGDVGIAFTRTSHVRLQGNRVTGATTGIRLTGMDDAKVRANRTSDGGDGTVLRDSRRVRVRHHTAEHNTGSGVLIDAGSGRNKIERSSVDDNDGIDAVDESEGDRTAGTGTTWDDVFCLTSNPEGLCSAG